LLFDEIDELFSNHFDDSTRLTWSIDVYVSWFGQRRSCPLLIDAWKHVPREAVVGTHPRPSFYVRAAITLDTHTLVSQWHIDWEGGLEDALTDLRRAHTIGEAVIGACFFCKWSDYAMSSSTGNLVCFRASKAAYEAIATSEDARTRKYEKESLGGRVDVDELYVCDDFEKRPWGFGYRG
jgi:hypothetical protein